MIYIVCDYCGHMIEKHDGYAAQNFRCAVCERSAAWMFSDKRKAIQYHLDNRETFAKGPFEDTVSLD